MRNTSSSELEPLSPMSKWNAGGFFILATSGVLMNFVIARAYGSGVLGMFNQVFAIYVILSQFAFGGLCLSTLKSICAAPSDSREHLAIVTAALWMVSLIALGVCGLAWVLRQPLALWLHSPGVAAGIQAVIPGLWCFGLNKILLAAANGMERTRFYTGVQALRYVLMLVFVSALTLQGVPGEALPVALAAAEAAVLVINGFYVFRQGLGTRTESCRPWFLRHGQFAWKVFPAGLVMDVNVRMSILILGVFFSDPVVGIYSFAALMAESLAQVPMLVIMNRNPDLPRRLEKGWSEELNRLFADLRWRVCFFATGAGMLSLAFFPPLVSGLQPRDALAPGLVALGILAAGVAFSASYLPLDLLVLRVYRPKLYARFLGGWFVINTLLAAVFIPPWGMLGAAVATALSFLLQVVVLRLLTRQVLNII